MAMYVNYTHSVTHSSVVMPREDYLEWHVGEEVPNIQLENKEKVRIESIYADGHEFQHIIDNFPNLPYAKGRSSVWRGELATFIYDNLQ